MTTNWIEEKFNKIYPYGIVRKYKKLGYVDLSDDIKHLITTLLEKQREEYVYKIEKYKKSYQYETGEEAVVSTCNEIINIIKSYDKKE